MKRTKAVAGPFLGELGYELCYWLPYIRYIINSDDFVGNFDAQAVMVREERVDLYKDLDCPLHILDDVSGMGDQWRYNNIDKFWGEESIIEASYPEEFDSYYKIVTAETLWECPRMWSSYKSNEHGVSSYDCLVHMRNKGDSRDLHPDFWEEFYEILDADLSVGIIGTDKDDYNGRGEDLRGVSLAELISYMSVAKCVMGAISGPLHLASLCETPHIAVGNPDMPISEVGPSREVFEEHWNPFGTPIVYVEGNYESKSFLDNEKIIDAIEEFCR